MTSLYYFNPCGCGQHWFVMAESREAAVEAVRERIRALADTMWPAGPRVFPPGDSRTEETINRQRLDWVRCELARLEEYLVPREAQRRGPCIEVLGPGKVVGLEVE